MLEREVLFLENWTRTALKTPTLLSSLTIFLHISETEAWPCFSIQNSVQAQIYGETTTMKIGDQSVVCLAEGLVSQIYAKTLGIKLYLVMHKFLNEYVRILA